MQKSTIIKTIIFFALLVLANLFLLRPGFWFYQDAGFWPKNDHEAAMLLIQQFHIYTNLGYYIGSDQGLLSFTRILIIGFTSFVFFLFKQNVSQVIFTFSGYILTFVSFYLFSGIFFKDNRLRYILSLIYVFNPLTYSLQGYAFYNATIPLFIYSFNKYFFVEKRLRLAYLLLNIFTSFIWVSYIRFIQGNSFIIIPYLIYLIVQNKERLRIKRIIIYVLSYPFVFAPIIFAFLSQLLEKSETAFNYGKIFGNSVVKYKMLDAFNIFQSVGAKLYEGKWWSIVGLLFSFFLIYLIITVPRRNHTRFYFLNLLLFLFGITLFRLSNIFGSEFYLKVIHYVPFIINEPFWALYIVQVPYVILLGLLTRDRIKLLYIFSFFFITLATFPLLRLSDFQLQKFTIDSSPEPYKTYFMEPFTGIPEASYYFLGDCWRAKFMDEANTPTLCLNYGHHYPPIIFNNPRVVSGDAYDISQLLYASTHLDNLRITHNLKNIFVPNDIVQKKGPNPRAGEKEIKMIQKAHQEFRKNQLLVAKDNPNFTQYFFANKDTYDFFLYSPNTLVESKNLDILTNDKLDINSRPVLFTSVSSLPPDIAKNIKLEYKLSPLSPFKYYVHVSNINEASPFIIQLNQKYSDYWKIKVIDKNVFDEKQCLGGWKIFPVTNNSYCQFKTGFIDVADVRYLTKNTLSTNNHLEGNLQANAWVVYPNNIVQNKELYLVIIYTKQIYYTYAIMISLITGFIILIIVLLQELRLRKDL